MFLKTYDHEKSEKMQKVARSMHVTLYSAIIMLCHAVVIVMGNANQSESYRPALVLMARSADGDGDDDE